VNAAGDGRAFGRVVFLLVLVIVIVGKHWSVESEKFSGAVGNLGTGMGCGVSEEVPTRNS
jgi:hypothetical protein